MKKRISVLIIVMLLACTLAFVGCEKAEETKTYTVTFDYDHDYMMSSVLCVDGAKVTAPEIPTREGYEFSHWANAGKQFDFNTPIIKDVTLKAVWNRLIDVNVVVYGEKKTLRMGEKDSYTLEEFGVSREGAKLEGLYTLENGVPTLYDMKSKIEGKTLYASLSTEGVKYADIEGTDAVAVVGYEGSATDVYIPTFYNNKRVLEIGKLAFNKVDANTYNLPLGLENIRFGAFSESNVDTINVACTLKLLERNAFSNIHVKHINFEDGIEGAVVEARAFSWIYDMERLALPTGFDTLRADTVQTCQNLKEIYVPNTVLNLENYAFRGCFNLEKIYRQKKAPDKQYVEGFTWNHVGEQGPGAMVVIPVVTVKDITEFNA